eukprot:TRINITY_DN7401_c0_g1_i1.p1 TRINITY_DN7401_c0_g1~~TRINITY_DN7401_c0_g1_i1.p1  ORF type:complete len:378 (+),score=27.21 TRINITY_DN7401_c0_g1_i1:129-1136(+)
MGPQKSLKNAQIYCDSELTKILKGKEEIITDHLNQSSDLYFFLVELKQLLEKLVTSHKDLSQPPALYYPRLLDEINIIGWKNIGYIDDNMTCLKVNTKDDAGRNHVIELGLSSDYPHTPPKCTTFLPESFDILWDSRKSTLADVINQFTKALKKYQEFWYIVDDIDTKTCVLDPQNPTRADTKRRLAIGKFVSLSIVINPAAPRSVPVCRFLGSDNAIEPLKQNLNSNLHNWDYKNTLRENLEQTLNIEFPTPKETDIQEFNVECAICYEYKGSDGDEIPDRICNGKNCGKSFHSSCLYSWLSNIRSNRQTFDTIIGSCPYCETQIAIKITNKRS